MSNFKKIIPIISENVSIKYFSKDEYLLKQSEFNYFLKINKETYNLINLFDGLKNLEEISSTYNKMFKSNINVEIIYNIFFVKLQKYGILENTKTIALHQEKPNYLKLSFIFLSNKFLSKITPLFYVLFKDNRIFILSIISLFIIVTSFFVNFHLFEKNVNYQSIFYFYLLVTISDVFHELGHASATSYFGANHGGVGMGFYLFMPVFFADVSDIWRLKKNKE